MPRFIGVVNTKGGGKWSLRIDAASEADAVAAVDMYAEQAPQLTEVETVYRDQPFMRVRRSNGTPCVETLTVEGFKKLGDL
jgi:hypothetical protein